MRGCRMHGHTLAACRFQASLIWCSATLIGVMRMGRAGVVASSISQQPVAWLAERGMSSNMHLCCCAGFTEPCPDRSNLQT